MLDFNFSNKWGGGMFKKSTLTYANFDTRVPISDTSAAETWEEAYMAYRSRS